MYIYNYILNMDDNCHFQAFPDPHLLSPRLVSEFMLGCPNSICTVWLSPGKDYNCPFQASRRAPFCHPFRRVELPLGILPLPFSSRRGQLLVLCCFISGSVRIIIHKAPAENRRHLLQRRSSRLQFHRSWAWSGTLPQAA